MNIVVLGHGAEVRISTDGHEAELIVVDIDFGGRKRGVELLEHAYQETRSTLILLGSSLDSISFHLLTCRCHFLLQPVRDDQLKATIQLALAQRTLSADCHPLVENRRHQLEAALYRIRTTLRGLSAPLTVVQEFGASLDGLRPREHQIIELMLEHHRVPAIADALGISAHTVRNHLKNIYRRLGVHTQEELLRSLKGATAR